MIKIISLVLLTVCVCLPGLYAQESTTQGWAAGEPRQRSSNAISLAAKESHYEVARLTPEAFKSAVGQNETAGKSLLPFPVLMPKAIVYPRKAIRKGWEGRAVVAVEIVPGGTVGRTALAKSSGHELLDNTAQEAIRTWKFGTESEKEDTVPQYVDIPVTFKLQNED